MSALRTTKRQKSREAQESRLYFPYFISINFLIFQKIYYGRILSFYGITIISRVFKSFHVAGLMCRHNFSFLYQQLEL